ncbi:MAG: hypothetical protein H7246_18895 [Phycisphaerae bacterium]|nr:hypothetical protein [Saprospiraceae bacterium]
MAKKANSIIASPEPGILDPMARYGIYPAIGIARLGNSPDKIFLSPEQIGNLPIACNDDGSIPGGQEQPTHDFKDSAGLIKRQAARFKVLVYDRNNPNGKEVQKGDIIVGEGTSGKLLDIEWTVWVANKKASWYQFEQLAGEHGYAPDHPLRNADVTDPNDRQNLIIDPGPQTVSMTGYQSAAKFKKGENPSQTQNFPPPLNPNSIDTLGDINCIEENGNFRLIVRGGHGNSGSYKSGPQDPKINNYANNDGWFDDTSDGPVTAKLLFLDETDDQIRFQVVQDAAWVITGYPAYAPQIVGMITLNDTLYDLYVQQFAYDTYLYGKRDQFDSNVKINTPEQLQLWRDDITKMFNPNYYPFFWRDIWPILTRPYNMQWVTAFLGTSNVAHDTSDRGDFAKKKVSIPPTIGPDGKIVADQWRGMRKFIYEALRKPHEENVYYNDRADWAIDDPNGIEFAQFTKKLMPLLCGDNPLSNTNVAKFLKLTDTQLFFMKQWASGKFINEQMEAWESTTATTPPPIIAQPDTGLSLTTGVLDNLLGGSFCPGAEVSWIIRNPNIWAKPFRVKTDPLYVPNLSSRSVSDTPGITTAFEPPPLTLSGDISNGLQPGDITKYSALPWQSDFNECATQPIDITYEHWNNLYPDPDINLNFDKVQTQVETLWWPWHRPMQVFFQIVTYEGSTPNYIYRQMDWSTGIPQTNAGDLKMVTAWNELGFVVNNYNDLSNGVPPYVVVIDGDDPANKQFLGRNFNDLNKKTE